MRIYLAKKLNSIRAFFVAALLLGVAHAQTESILYSFCKGITCTDGSQPEAGLILDKQGNLYGTTFAGGAGDCAGGCGTVFELSATGQEKVLYSFCTKSDCADGGNPAAGLTFDAEGNLYGTTEFGGVFLNSDCNVFGGCGTVFKLDPTTLQETVLYKFCSKTNCADGSQPVAGLTFDTDGNLYGTTLEGGAAGVGTVFKLNTAGVETVLYSFCAKSNCVDGQLPRAGVIIEGGNLYGTTSQGGAADMGTIFQVTPQGKEAVYSFCSRSNCADGAIPEAALVFNKGNLYGTTSSGGSDNNGTVFQITAKAKETVLYSFCPGGVDCADGSTPVAGLVFDKSGNLYGTTQFGGMASKYCTYTYCGTVFKLTPQRKETVLYSFCSQTSCNDGALPLAGLVFDSQGNLYGTTQLGGLGAEGVVFEVTP